MYNSDGRTVNINDRIISETNWDDPASIGKANIELWRGRDHKSRLEKLAWRGESFLIGDQWFEWDNNTNQMAPNPRKQNNWRAKLVFNDIYPGIEQRTSSFSRQGRIFSTMAESESMDAKIVQKTQDKVMAAYWQHLKMPKYVRELLQWASSSAICWGHVTWDKTLGNEITESLDEWLFEGAMIADPVEKESFIRRRTNEFYQAFGIDAANARQWSGKSGDVKVEILPIYQVDWWPHNAKCHDDIEIFQVLYFKTFSQAEEILGVPEATLRSQLNKWRHEAETMWADHYFFGDVDFDPDSLDYCPIFKIYRKPCGRYPKGREAIAVGFGGYIPNPPTDLTSSLNRIPIFPFVEKPIRGNYAGTCSVDQCASAQIDRNTSASQWADYRNSRIAPTLVEFGKTNKANNQYTAKPGTAITVDRPEDMPQSIKMPDIPSDHFQTAEIARQWINGVLGTLPFDVGGDSESSGRALVARREMVNARLVPIGEALDEHLSEVGSEILALLQSYAHTKRLLPLVGEDNVTEMVAFRSSDIRPSSYGQPGFNRAAVRVGCYSNIPKSSTEMFNFVSMLIENQFFTLPPKIQHKILDMMHMSEVRTIFDETLADEMNARTNIRMWESGQLVDEPNPDDDDDTHIQSIVNWKKTDGYKMFRHKFRNIPQLVMQPEQHLMTRKQNAARKILEPQYAARAADLSLFTQYRAKMMNDYIMAPTQGLPPEVAQQHIERNMMLVNMELPAPLMAMGAMGGGQPQGNGGDKQEDSKEDKPSGDGPGRPKESSGSENQGVKKEDQI